MTGSAWKGRYEMGKKLLMLFAFMSLLGNAAGALRAQSALPPLTHAQEALIRKIEGRLMAPCCYTQTIRDHDSQVAEEMREEVTDLVVSGKSEKEIITYYRTKYGETILAVPDGFSGALLVILPISALLVSAGALLVHIRRSAGGMGSSAVLAMTGGTEAQRTAIQKRIRAELGDF